MTSPTIQPEAEGAAGGDLPRWLGLVLTLAAGGFIALRIFLPAIALEMDSSRYIAMGLNLADHGTLSGETYDRARAPAPGLFHGGVLTAFELALASLHGPTRETLFCLLATARPGLPCPGTMAALKLLYFAEVAIFLVALYRITRLLGLPATTAWLAVLAALLCREIWRYTPFILSEPLFLMTVGLFLWAWLAAWRQPARRNQWLLAGLTLGAVMLVKPAWNAMLPALLAMMLWPVWREAALRRFFLAGMVWLALGYAVLTLPLLLRNVLQLGVWTLSDPHYLVGSLSHRLAFNLMSWREWAIGLLYYLPDFGDSWARALWGRDAGAGIGWDAGSYYVHGRDVLHPQLMLLEPGLAVRQLMHDYIVAMPLKNAAVTALLALRGLFVGTKWGLVAVLLLPLALLAMPQAQRRLWLLLVLPALFMLMVNAQASVSLPRYNLALIPALAVILAVTMQLMLGWLGRRAYVSGLLAKAKAFLPKS